MRILFVAPYVPSPIRVRPYQWIRALSRLGQEVELVALQPPEDRWLAEVPAREFCTTLRVFPLGRVRTVANAAAAVPRALPLQAAYSVHPEAERYITARAKANDVVHVEHLRGAMLTRGVEGVPRVIDAVDSITRLFEQASTQARSWKHRLMARVDLARTRQFEADLPRRFDRVVVSSVRDASAFGGLVDAEASSRVVAVPNGVDLEHFRPHDRPADPATVLFTGKMSYHANAAAALRLVQQIMPLVWRRRPDARVVLAGKDPSPAIQALARDSRVSVTGFVADLRPSFWAATAVVAPLVYGTGIQNKVLEAMACGIPVVASPKACEGIRAVEGRDLFVGTTDEDLARHVIALLGDGDARRRIGLEGRRYVAANHDWYDMGRRLIGVYEEARASRRRCA
jgi:glycosyltransferase involved in cell wall biosynthesis